MNKASKRHHYLPEFYAKGFLGEDKKFYVYDKLKDTIRKKKVSPKEVFYEWNRNTVSADNGSTDVMEDYYSRLDSECAKAIQELRDKPNEGGIHTVETISLLRFFIINLFWRVPKSDFAALNYFDKAKITFTDKETGEIIEKPELEEKLKSDPNHLKLIRPNFPNEIIMNIAKPKKGKSNSQLFEFEEEYFLIGDYPILFKKTPSQVDELLNGDFILPISSKRIYRTTEGKLELNFSFDNAVDFNALLIEQSEYYICGPNKEYLEKCVKYWKLMKSQGILWYLPRKLF
jgi:hypothetical protein